MTNEASRSDFEQASKDCSIALSESPYDVLCLSIRSAIRAAQGDLVGAQADLGATNEAIVQERAFRSAVGDDDCDLEFVARGCAYASVCPSSLSFSVPDRAKLRLMACTMWQVRDFASAAQDFAYALGLRSSPYVIGKAG